MTYPASGVSPTAPDEHEALRVDLEAFIAEKPTLNHYSEFTSSFKSGWLAGFRSSREATTEPAADYRAWVCARCGMAPEVHAWSDSICVYSPALVGPEPAREATTEPQPITDADVEVAFHAALRSGAGQVVRDDMRAALEAVEASRSPKPTEQENGS